MTINNQPFFSIVTISFNQANYLNECIESVINQNFDDFEYIIQDPGSQDNSREIIKSYKSNKLSYFFEKDQSPPNGLNKGFSKASGKYYLFLNSDDILCENALSTFYKIINDNPDFDVYSGAAKIIDEKGQKLRETFSDKFDINMAAYGGNNILVQPSTTFKASLFKSVNGFNENNLCSWDGELFIDFGMKNAKFYKTKKIISKYRITKDSITGSGRLSDLIQEYHRNMFRKVYKKEINIYYYFISFFYRCKRKILNLDDTINRILYGKIYKRKL